MQRVAQFSSWPLGQLVKQRHLELICQNNSQLSAWHGLPGYPKLRLIAQLQNWRMPRSWCNSRILNCTGFRNGVAKLSATGTPNRATPELESNWEVGGWKWVPSRNRVVKLSASGTPSCVQLSATSDTRVVGWHLDLSYRLGGSVDTT